MSQVDDVTLQKYLIGEKYKLQSKDPSQRLNKRATLLIGKNAPFPEPTLTVILYPQWMFPHKQDD